MEGRNLTKELLELHSLRRERLGLRSFVKALLGLHSLKMVDLEQMDRVRHLERLVNIQLLVDVDYSLWLAQMVVVSTS